MAETEKISIKKIISSEKIEKRISELAVQIENDYRGKKLLAVCVLKGSIIFFSDLIKKLDLLLEAEFIQVSSYGNDTVSSQKADVIKGINSDISGYDVLIVEDIIDTGNTLCLIRDMILEKNPKSLRICTLLDKPSRREKDISADYTGFAVDNIFVVGYGLDIAQKYRNLPFIGVIEDI